MSSGTRVNQLFKSSESFDNFLTKQMLQLLVQYAELLLHFPLLELFAMSTKGVVVEREALHRKCGLRKKVGWTQLKEVNLSSFLQKVAFIVHLSCNFKR